MILQVEEREQAIIEVDKEVIELKVRVEEEAKELEKIHVGLKGTFLWATFPCLVRAS